MIFKGTWMCNFEERCNPNNPHGFSCLYGPDIIQCDGPDSKGGCDERIEGDHYKTLRAAKMGWFFKQNGEAWCPLHLPAWVPEWRAKKAAGKNGTKLSDVQRVLLRLDSMKAGQRKSIFGASVYYRAGRQDDGGPTVTIGGITARYQHNTDAARSIAMKCHVEPVDGQVWLWRTGDACTARRADSACP